MVTLMKGMVVGYEQTATIESKVGDCPVLEDIRRENVDQIICLGDAATLGPLPSEVIARLQEYNCRCILGNHDEYLLQPHLIYSYTHEQPIINAVQWCHDRLSDEEIAYLSAFPRTMEIAIDPMITLICFHGSPKSNTDIILRHDRPLILFASSSISSGMKPSRCIPESIFI